MSRHNPHAAVCAQNCAHNSKVLDTKCSAEPIFRAPGVDNNAPEYFTAPNAVSLVAGGDENAI